MGKYSLDHYERYKTIKIRPEESAQEPHNLRCGEFTSVSCKLSGEIPALSGGTTLLRVIDDMPNGALPLKADALSRLGAARADDPGFIGITFATSEPEPCLRLLLAEACDAFRPHRLFVSVIEAALIRQLMADGLPFGLLADIERHPYDVCEAFAEGGLQKLWQRVPVLVCGATDEYAAYARRWHALAGEGVGGGLGWRIALRRLTYPMAVCSGGYAPLRFWWANSGSSPCYEQLTPCLRLRVGERLVPLMLHDNSSRFEVGDRTYNEIIRLPELPQGVWPLECALTDAAGLSVALAQAGRLPDGWYDVGAMTIDGKPHPELADAWDDYYPEGYYPLEDPAQPE